jgi:hypothetical protein
VNLYILKLADNGTIEESISGSLLLPPDEYLFRFDVSPEIMQNLFEYKVINGEIVRK